MPAIIDGIVAQTAALQTAKKRGLLIVQSGGLGDAILFSLMIERFMRLVEPDEPVTLILRSESAGAPFLFPDRVTVIGIDYRRFIRSAGYRWQQSRCVRALGARIAVCADHLRLPTVSDALIRASAANESYALTPKSWPKHDAALTANRALYTRWVEPDPAMQHRLIRWWELINALEGGVEAPPVVKLDPAYLPAPSAAPKPRIVLHPFSAVAEREAAPEIFVAVAKAFAATCEVVVSAGPNDLARAPRHVPLSEVPGVRVDTSSIKDKAALLRGAALCVSVDSSIMHLAVGVGAPTLCVASAAHIVDSVPYDPRMMPENVRFSVPEIECAGCLGNCIHPFKDGRYLCLSQHTPDGVVALAHEMLGAAV